MSKKGIRWTPEQYQAYLDRTGQATTAAAIAAPEPKPDGPKVRKQREMNATEKGFHQMQEARVRKGELLEVIYEPLSFAIGGGVRYKVDFMLRDHDNKLVFVEIKGRKIWTQDLVRYKIAADKWGWLGEFQLWTGIKGTYTRIR